MEINVKDDRKTVEIWLTRAEKQDAVLRERLKPLYKEYRDRKYLVAVFQSGERDLTDATSDLICYNRKRLAEQETVRERQQGMSMSM